MSDKHHTLGHLNHPPGIPEARHQGDRWCHCGHSIEECDKTHNLHCGFNGVKSCKCERCVAARASASPAGLDFEKAEDETGSPVCAALDYPVRVALNSQHLAALQQREAEVTARVKRETRERIVAHLREYGTAQDVMRRVPIHEAADFISTLELE